MKNNPDNSTEESETSRNRKLLRSHVPDITHVEEKPELKVDLRIEVIAHNVILKDEERMGQLQEVLEKLRTGSHTKSIREDLRKQENSMIFSEESKRIIHEQGNIGLHEALKHLPEGQKFCMCGIYLRPDEDTIRKIG